MKKHILALSALSLLFSCQQAQQSKEEILSVTSPKGTNVYQDNWENIGSNYQCPEWFKDAKFGIFIHWGVYAVPAFGNEWYPRNMYTKDSKVYKHHLETYGKHTEFGYKDFIPMFKAEKFNAKEWVSIFKAAGAKYVVPVAEHHDGFSMYDSDRNPWNSVKMGPKKDIIGLLKTEIEKEGLIFGLSSHRLENSWFYNEGMKFPSDVQDTTLTLYGARLPEQDKYNEAVGLDWLAHVRELIDKYQPQLIWFDWTVGNEVIQPFFNKFLAYYYNNSIDWGKGVVVNTKQGYPNNVQIGDVERGKLNKIRKYPWQTDTSVGKKSWAYIDGEENKTPQQIVHDLIDIVSKNGNLLLNIGPRADGTITEEQKSVLLSIGSWLKVNGEAIYGSRPWVRSGEGEAVSTAGSFTDNTATEYSAQDIRFTTKNNTLYAIALNWSDKDILIHSLDKKGMGNSKIQQISLLGSDEKIHWKQTEKGIQISFPKEKPCEFAYTFKIIFDKMAGSALENEMIDIPMVHHAN